MEIELVCEGPSAHGVERGAPPAAPGVLLGGGTGRPKHPSEPRNNLDGQVIWEENRQ